MNYSKLIFLVAVFLLILNFFTFSALAFEQEPLELERAGEEQEFSRDINSGTLLLRYLFSVLGVIFLTYLALKFFSQKFRIHTLTGDWIRVLDQLSLGANKGIFLVEIEGKGYVLGVTDAQINVLTIIEDEIRLEELRSSLVEPVRKTGWRNKIWGFRSNKQGDFNQSLQYNLQKIQNLYSDKEEDEKYEK